MQGNSLPQGIPANFFCPEIPSMEHTFPVRNKLQVLTYSFDLIFEKIDHIKKTIWITILVGLSRNFFKIFSWNHLFRESIRGNVGISNIFCEFSKNLRSQKFQSQAPRCVSFMKHLYLCIREDITHMCISLHIYIKSQYNQIVLICLHLKKYIFLRWDSFVWLVFFAWSVSQSVHIDTNFMIEIPWIFQKSIPIVLILIKSGFPVTLIRGKLVAYEISCHCPFNPLTL